MVSLENKISQYIFCFYTERSYTSLSSGGNIDYHIKHSSHREAGTVAEFSVLIGGKAGDGISQAGQVIGSVFSSLGYHVYQYVDYPSLIRGGHNFCIIRAAEYPVTAFRSGVDVIIAFDQQTADLHKGRLSDDGIIISDANRVKAPGLEIPLGQLINTHQGIPIMGNTAMISALFRYLGVPWDRIEPVLKRKNPKKTEKNLEIARAAWDILSPSRKLGIPGGSPKPFLSGNEWIGLGLLAGGLDAYVAYPMTPSSGILHFLASIADEAGIQVYHPESEIAVILMALGFSYAGKKAAVGTSGGGFCLMTEGLSLAGQAEIPIVIVVSQRTGPSTGLPTYTAQSDLMFIRHAGQGEFPRWIAAPGTPEEAIFLGAEAVRIAWKFQVPAFIITDKTFSEGLFTGSADLPDLPPHRVSAPAFPYHRYEDMPDGISPLLAPPHPGEVVKVNSYTHDFKGITTEDPQITIAMVEKRKRKELALKEYTDQPESVRITGNEKAPVCVIAWGSVRGQVAEIAKDTSFRFVSPLILEPFPIKTFMAALEGVDRIIVVEESAAGQIDKILKEHGIVPDEIILRYDGRPSTIEELETRIRRVL